MRKYLFPAAALGAALGLALDSGFFAPVPAAGRNGGGVTVQSTPQELEITSENYRYFLTEQEPSEEAERHYLADIVRWLDGLPPEQGVKARKILREAHPELSALRKAIREKKGQLASLSFGRDTPPETLPRLGQELQALRARLAARLNETEEKLNAEAGVALSPLGGEGFWLAAPAAEKTAAKKAPDK